MNIGGYDLYSIETSRFGLDGVAMFGIIPKPI
ncbi:MAG: MBL fold metallo-hydrolase, partial [Candidatus Marinimicrobia bacterium]|nr:MBL fold metallo-hydrolase [Candidatus Neomarinimicrobiota bacterium]